MASPHMPVTIRDIARTAGVSVSTASRALNKKSDVSKETRERVLRAAHDLQFAVNLHARALTGATSKTIGFVIYDSSTAFHAMMSRGVEEVAAAHGYSMIVCNTGGVPGAELRAYQMLREKRVDGMLVNSVQSGSAPLRQVAAEGIPFVLLNRRLDDLDSDHVLVDYRRGAYLATSLLLQLGHCRILHQTAQADHPPVHERILGYRDALAEYGIPFDPDLLVYCGGDMQAGYVKMLDALTRLRPRPTAIATYNDLWTIPVLRALSELSLRVPQDMAVVGHNDLAFARFLVPPLTSVAQPIHELGRQGAEILFRKLAWADGDAWTPQHVVLEPELVVRESSGSRITVASVSHQSALVE